MTGDFKPVHQAHIEWQGNTPMAPDFADRYFSTGQGLAESEAVFIQGNDLPDRFSALPEQGLFVIGETGFGTGLNMLLAAQRFSEYAPATARLHLVSVEKFPLTRTDLRRALEQWPELNRWAGALVEQYPEATAGFHRIRLSEHVHLTLMFGDAVSMWNHHCGSMDAWFLDGFAPDRNPDIWQPGLFHIIAEKSRPGATVASFSVAAMVRNGLAAAGFNLEKKTGFGRKRHRLEGHLPGQRISQTYRNGSVLVAGAGLAGATTARALAERGWHVTVIDTLGIAQGVSGNRAGVVYTTPSAHATAQNRYYQNSYLHALRWLARHEIEQAGIGRLNGVIQHLPDSAKAQKIRTALASGHWPDSLLRPVDEHTVELVGGGYLQPARWCGYLLDHARIELRQATVKHWVRFGLQLDSAEQLQAEHTVLCLSGQAKTLTDLDWLPIRMIRGQVSYCAETPASSQWQKAECHRGYLTPSIHGLHCIGATFNLHEHDPQPNPSDNQANADQLERYLPKRWQELGGHLINIVDQRVGFRCQSNDYLPIAGAMVDANGEAQAGLWLNLAFGSRGIGGTPLCAEQIADQISGLPTPMDSAMARALSPSRFAERKRRRQSKASRY